MITTPFLRALLEADGDDENKKKPGKITTAEEAMEDTASLNPEEDVRDSSADENGNEGTEGEAVNPDSDDEGGGEGADPFSDDGGDDMGFGDEGGEGEEEEDLSDNPDGLASPDDEGDGEGGMGNDEEDEQNIQLNILPLSKLDRLSLKRRCLSDFRDLQFKTNRVKRLVDDNEQLISIEEREDITSQLGQLNSDIGLYLTTKFSYNNYEENYKNYNILCSQLDELIKMILKTKPVKQDRNNG